MHFSNGIFVLAFSTFTKGIVSSDIFAEFSKTNILQNKCDSSILLRTSTERSLKSCAGKCTEEPECRKYLYCSRDSSCKLYLDGSDCIMSSDSTDCSCFKKDIGCNSTNCVCPIGYFGDKCEDVIKDCTDGFERGITYEQKVISYIKPGTEVVEAYCYFRNGGSTYALQRYSLCNYENFNRSISEYKNGFGSSMLNRWLGLQNIYLISTRTPRSELMIELKGTNKSFCKIYYKGFTLSDEKSGYAFNRDTVNPHSSESYCGDSITGNKSLAGNRFSTYDNDVTGGYQCARRNGGGWWYDSDAACTRSLLTGSMDGSGTDNFWQDDRPDERLSRIVWRIKVNI